MSSLGVGVFARRSGARGLSAEALRTAAVPRAAVLAGALERLVAGTIRPRPARLI
ncbi:MAG TPA: hypothetical protein VNN74_06595 [Candidatus Micrarchaeia archaeon]|nr:hypothetical protein [Candidatus Micrarchaeia archaeon]